VSEDERRALSREVALRSRRRVGLSQEVLAVRASLHRTEIGMLEHGQRVARIDTVIRLAGAMSIPPSDLIAGMSWTPGEIQGGTFEFEDLARPRRPRRRPRDGSED
jgi:transcriptional regulator with XRE-family HTH domain